MFNAIVFTVLCSEVVWLIFARGSLWPLTSVFPTPTLRALPKLRGCSIICGQEESLRVGVEES